MYLQHSNQTVNVVAEASEAYHGQQFVSCAWRITTIPANIDEQWRNCKCVDQIDPGIWTLFHNADEGTIAVIDNHEDADKEKTAINPGRAAGALKGDPEEARGQDKDVAEGKYEMLVRVVGHF